MDRRQHLIFVTLRWAQTKKEVAYLENDKFYAMSQNVLIKVRFMTDT